MNLRLIYFIQHTARPFIMVPGFFLLLLWLTGCTTESKRAHKIDTAFYYWKTNFRISPYERKILQETGTRALYLRLFDVDWSAKEQKALPLGMLQSEHRESLSLKYIPVVYITQPCLSRLQEKDIPELAANISKLMAQLCERYQLRPEELQIDCDWTRNTADIYFRLLKQLKQQDFFAGKLLSCTIRLHQVKYTSANGIPPADKGLLMVYNMGNLTRYGGHNSVLDPDEASQYLKILGSYALPLDVALPIYHWAALFEQQRFKGIVYNITLEQFGKDLLELVEGHLYRIKKDNYTGGYTFKAGQEIRFEAPGIHDLEQMAAFIGNRIKDSTFRLVYFHLDSLAMQPYTAADLNAIRKAF
jgi:hypothetical protein